jgi:hypothetical protein
MVRLLVLRLNQSASLARETFVAQEIDENAFNLIRNVCCGFAAGTMILIT